MNRFYLVVAFFALVMPRSVYAQETITSFSSSLSLTRGDDVLVREQIRYDFGEVQRHGIYRDLPEQLCPGAACVSTGVEFFPAARDGKPEPYTMGGSSQALRQRIGDPESTVTGPHTYDIGYTLERLVVEKNGEQLVSWNVTGDLWTAPILLSTFRMEGPVSPLRVQCYTGKHGSKNQACQTNIVGAVVMATTTHLAAKEGWTVDVWYPANTFAVSVVPVPPPPIPYWLAYILLMTFAWAVVWWLFGKDTKGRGTIIPEYNPPKDLKPYEAAALFQQTSSARGITATVMDFAYRKLITIRAEKGTIKTTYILVRERTPKANELDAAEQTIFDALFPEGEKEFEVGRRSSAAGAKFLSWLREVNDHLKERGWHVWNAANVRGVSIMVVFAMGFAGMYIVSRFTPESSTSLLSMLGVITALPFAYAMPKTTREGALVLEHIKGFKQYIRIAEKDRLAFHEGPQATPERFSALLPFAVALHEERAWSKIFADIPMSETHLSGYGAGVTTGMIADLSHGITSGLGSSMVSSSGGSGGGGFSGGGGGGGGGGSW